MCQELAINAGSHRQSALRRLAIECCEELGLRFLSVETMAGGRNSGASLVKTETDEFVLKIYRQPGWDGRVRYLRERAFLDWAGRAEISEAPKLLTKCNFRKWIAMERLSGRKPRVIEDGHILQAAQFIEKIADSGPIPRLTLPARHALQGGAKLSNQLRYRLHSLPGTIVDFAQVGSWLEAASWLFTDYANIHLEGDLKILRKYVRQVSGATDREQLFSPSDFGFHNAIESKEGDQMVLKFVDFEYAGVDHPLKLVLDFMLQPDQLLTDHQVNLFLATVGPRYGLFLDEIPEAVWRVFIFKWILIIAQVHSRETLVPNPSSEQGTSVAEVYWNRFGFHFE